MARIRIIQTLPVQDIEELLIEAIDESTTIAGLRTLIREKMRARLDAIRANRDALEPPQD